MATHDRLRALVDLARTLSASLDLDDVLRRVAGHATAVTGSSACSVSLWDRERDSLVTLTGWFGQIAGEMDAGQEEFLLSDFPASRDVLERQQTRLIRVANEADDPSERTLLAAEGYASLLMIPLVSRGTCLGLMEIVDESDRLWDDADLDFFRTLADIISAAVHNAVLRKQSTEAEERYRTLVENLPAVNLPRHRRHRPAGLRQPSGRLADGRGSCRVGGRPGRLDAPPAPGRPRRRRAV